MSKWQSLFTIPLLRTIPPNDYFPIIQYQPKQIDLLVISYKEQRTQNQNPTLTLLKAMSYLQGQENRFKPQQQRTLLSQFNQVST